MNGCIFFITLHDILIPSQNITPQNVLRGAMSMFSTNSTPTKLPLCHVQIHLAPHDESQEIIVYKTDAQRSSSPLFYTGFQIECPLHSDQQLSFYIMGQDDHNKQETCFGRFTCTFLQLYDCFKAKVATASISTDPVVFPIESRYFSAGRIEFSFASQVLPPEHRLLGLHNPMVKYFRFRQPGTDEQLIAVEEAGEVEMTTQVPASFLQSCYEEFKTLFEDWRQRYNIARIRELHFTDDAEGLDHGYDVYRVTIIKGRGLKGVEKTNFKPPESKSKSKNALNRFRSKAGIFVNAAAEAANQVGNRRETMRESGVSTNPFVCLAIKDHATSEPQVVGRTNTEYATLNPIWGSNTNTQACSHSKPSTKHWFSQKLHAKIESVEPEGDDQQNSATFKEFLFFRPASDHLEGFLEFQVFSESYTLLGGVENIANGIVRVDLNELEGLMTTSDETGVASISTLDWFPIADGAGELQLQLSIQKTAVRRAPGVDGIELEEAKESDPRPLPAPIAKIPTSALYFGLPNFVTDEILSANYDKVLPLSFIFPYVLKLKQHCDTVLSMIETTKTGLQETPYFKSSQLKKDGKLQGLPTNLHAFTFRLLSDKLHAQEKEISINDTLTERRMYSWTTGGAPAAHALGLQECGLSEMEQHLYASEERLKEKLSALFDGFNLNYAGTSETLLPEDSVENLYQYIPAMDEDEGGDSGPALPTAKKKKQRMKRIRKKLRVPLTIRSSPGDKSSSSISELVQTIEARKLDYFIRKTVVMSQCISILVTSFLGHIEVCLASSNGLEKLTQLVEIGYLVGWESLVSSQGKELHMLSDAGVAISSLARFSLRFARGDSSSGCSVAFGHIQEAGSSARHEIQLTVSSQTFDQLPPPLRDGAPIRIVPVLFTQGINEMQSFANMIQHRGTEIQRQINTASLHSIQQYYQQLIAWHQPKDAELAMFQKFLLRLEAAIESESNQIKDTSILVFAGELVRKLNGGRITYCKSGKDRTAMSVTLEEARLLHLQFARLSIAAGRPHYQPKDEDVLLVANILRAYGIRIEIALKNIGRPKYSFNALQRKLLPESYRPPNSTIQDMITSVVARDS